MLTLIATGFMSLLNISSILATIAGMAVGLSFGAFPG